MPGLEDFVLPHYTLRDADLVLCCRWQDMQDPDKFVCHVCYARDGAAAAMPKGHEDFVVGSWRWPKPEASTARQSVVSSPEPKRPTPSSTASETVFHKDAVPSGHASKAS